MLLGCHRQYWYPPFQIISYGNLFNCFCLSARGLISACYFSRSSLHFYHQLFVFRAGATISASTVLAAIYGFFKRSATDSWFAHSMVTRNLGLRILQKLYFHSHANERPISISWPTEAKLLSQLRTHRIKQSHPSIRCKYTSPHLN